MQGVHGIERGFAGLHGVDEIAPDLFQIAFRKVAGEQIDARGAHGGSFALRHELYALAGGIGTLIELSGQIFHGKGRAGVFRQLFEGVVHLRFGEDGLHRTAKDILVQTFHVVAVDEPQTGKGRDAQQAAQLAEQGGGFVSQGGLFLYIDASYHS